MLSLRSLGKCRDGEFDQPIGSAICPPGQANRKLMGTSTSKLAIRGVVFNWAGRVAGFVIAFVVTPILVHNLGKEAYGVWAIVMSFSTYYAIADLGLRGATVKFISQHDAVEEHDIANRVFNTSIGLYGMLAFVVLFASAGVAVIFPGTFETESVEGSTLQQIVILCGFSAAIVILGQAFSATLVAAMRFDRTNAIAIGAQLSQAVLVVTAVKLGGSLLAMACITLSVTLSAQLLTLFFALRAIPYLKPSPRCFDWATAKRLFNFGILVAVQGIGSKASRSAGAIIVGAVLNPAIAAYYVIAESLADKTAQLSKGFTSVLMPVASKLDAQNREAELVRALLLATRVLCAMASTLAVIFIVFGGQFIGYWIGPEFGDQSYRVLVVLSFAVLMQMTTIASRSVLRGAGKMRYLAIEGVVEAILTIGLGILLTSLFGLIGMATAIVVSQSVISALMLPVYLRRTFPMTTRQYVGIGILPGLLVAIPGACLAVLLDQYFTATNLVWVILYGGAVGMINATTLFGLGLEAEMRERIITSLIPDRFSRFIRLRPRPE